MPNPSLPSRTSQCLTPQTLDELLRLPFEQRLQVDIGRRNLLCAKGLPYAEDLDVDEYVERLDSWAARVGYRTEQHLPAFQRDPSQFDNSEPLWRMHAMCHVLEEDFGIHYRPERIDGDPDWTDSRDLFINGLLGELRTGTCPSLPVLLVAVGRRLGYPLKLVHSPGHAFCRWDAQQHENPAWRERFNVECHGKGMVNHSDEHYFESPVAWNVELHELERQRGAKRLFLRSLESDEELASHLCLRGHCLQAIGDVGGAWTYYQQALRHASHDDRYAHYCRDLHRASLETALRPWGVTPQHFSALTLSRLQGNPNQFPWEIAGRDIDAESASATSPGAPEAIARPLASATAAIAARHGYDLARHVPG